MTEFSAISYAVLGVCYTFLTVLLLTSWRGHRTGAFLILACIASLVWGVLLGLVATRTITSVPVVFTVEILRSGAWVTFLVALTTQVGVSRLLRNLCMAVWIAVLVVGALVYMTEPRYVADERIADVLIPGGFAITLAGLILIEQIYRNSSHDARWGLKSLVLGLGGLFAYDLFLYSQAMLFGALDSISWMARGAVNLFFIPFIAMAAKRNPTWDVDIFVSRHVVFYSTTLIAVGLYLVIMGIGGYALVAFGGNWGALAKVIFFVGALLVLAFLLFSNTLRARVKVFLSKHFFRNKYDYREEWLRLVSTLAEFEDSSTREIVIKALTQIVGSSSGVLWLRDEDGVYRVSAQFGITGSAPDIGSTEPIVEFMDSESWLIDLDEYRDDPDLYDNLILPEWLLGDPKAWLIVPLSSRRLLVGVVLVNRPPARMTLNYEDRDLLKTVGNHIAVHLAQEKSDSLLTEARQFEAYNRLTAFLMHDLNNLIAQQSLIVANAERHKRNPEFVDDAIQTIANSVERMKRVMEQLRRGSGDGQVRPVAVRDMLEAAIRNCADRLPQPELQLEDRRCLVNVDRDRFVMVVAHLIRNAQDATPDDGEVLVGCGCDAAAVTVTIRDTGVGMDSEFVRERLFRPFDSTKGSQGMGIGAYQAREFVRATGGELKVESEVSSGTTIALTLPIVVESREAG